ncbi:MAG TPA: MFS transporter [Burkholderiales bacterium]|nr:MFS transporter [Burkholderiales bacterium]
MHWHGWSTAPPAPAFCWGWSLSAIRCPLLVVMPFAGLLSDRYDRRRILIIAHSLAALQALALGLLTLSGAIQTWQILLLGFLYGVIMAFETPARQSLISQMVASREDLPNAIALNSFLMNSGRLVGPSIAGLLLLFATEGWCFLINSVSFLAVISAAVMMRLEPKKLRSDTTSLFVGLGEAASYAWHARPIRVFLMLVAWVSLTATPYPVLMPIFARDVFHGGAQTLGFLVGCAGFGAVIGTGFLATRPNVLGLSRLIATTSATAGLALFLVGLSNNYWLSLLLMACLGFGIIVTAASVNMMLQTMVEEDKRGRVISFYAMAFLGVAPFGGLMAGALASHIGAPVTAMIAGGCCLLGALLLCRHLPAIRADLHRALSPISGDG